MQIMSTITELLNGVDIEGEVTLFLCSAVAFIVLAGFRNKKRVKNTAKANTFQVERVEPAREVNDTRVPDVDWVQTDKALRSAFEAEDYWQVLKCWNDLKHLPQSSIHLSMVVRSMRFCNKGAYIIVGEIKSFLKTHQQMRSIGFVNELLEPLSRRSEDAQVVDLFMRMIPSLNLLKDSRTFEILLTMHAASRSALKAQELVTEMETRRVPISPRARVAMMTLAVHTNNIEAALQAFQALKSSWDERDTWAVSMFAVKSHKISILVQIVTLACQKQHVCELSAALEGMSLPDEVLDAARKQFMHMSDVDLATTITVMEKGDASNAPLYDALIACSKSRTTARAPWRARGHRDAETDASTSEGSRSDSEEEYHCQAKPTTPWISNARMYRESANKASANNQEGDDSE